MIWFSNVPSESFKALHKSLFKVYRVPVLAHQHRKLILIVSKLFVLHEEVKSIEQTSHVSGTIDGVVRKLHLRYPMREEPYRS